MQKHNSDRLKRLLQGYFQNTLSQDDYKLLWSLMDEETLSEELRELWQASGTDQITIGDDVWDDKMKLLIGRMDEEAPAKTAKRIPKVKSPVFKWMAAAVFIAVISTVSFLAYKRGMILDQEKVLAANPNVENDRPPGGNVAVLTLSNGKKILLDSSNIGMLGRDGGAGISRRDSGRLVYDAKGSERQSIAYNTVSTPHGGQFEIVLQDGSKVWLNSLSSIRYPTVFTGSERKVEISGEAYFEIARDVKPFIVEVKQMEVEVLGTHFNINSYEDEGAIKTTLLEGSVKVKSSDGVNFLKPGQQAKLSSDGTMSVVNHVNLNEVVAWKDGIFEFDKADIKTIMRQLMRWYDVEVVYNKPVDLHFGGSISRNVNLSKVLHMLEETGNVQFELKGNKIVVQP